jgi:hypothetical protein
VDVADDLGGGVDVGAGGDDGREAAVGAEHRISIGSCGPTRTAGGFA